MCLHRVYVDDSHKTRLLDSQYEVRLNVAIMLSR